MSWRLSPFAILRDRLNARDVRRWERRGRFPASLERTYWTAYEYQRDRPRMEQHGYRVCSERSNRTNPAATVDVAAPFFNQGVAYSMATTHYGMWLRRVPTVYRVSYERLSESVWGPTVAAAAKRWEP